MKYLFLVIILCLVILSPTGTVYAQDADSSTAAAEIRQKVKEYTLPYPGILPDNPLYFFKVTRDRIISFLISDSLKKAQFNLLQADKRLGAGVGLVGKENYALAESTFSKGLNYLEEAIVKTEDAQKEGKDTSGLVEEIDLSIKKHIDVFTGLQKETGKDFKESLEILMKRVEGYEKRVSAMKPSE